MTDKGIDNLKFGIIEQAAIDYVDLLAGFKSPTTDCNVDECRRFFRSQWFHSLCDLDPEQVINRLERKSYYHEDGSGCTEQCKTGLP